MVRCNWYHLLKVPLCVNVVRKLYNTSWEERRGEEERRARWNERSLRVKKQGIRGNVRNEEAGEGREREVKEKSNVK